MSDLDIAARLSVWLDALGIAYALDLHGEGTFQLDAGQVALLKERTSNPTTKGSTESVADVLTEAYHLIFDVKDAVTGDDEQARYLAYEACQKIAELMRALDLTPPRRFDGEGRGLVQVRSIEFPFTEAQRTPIGPFTGSDAWANAERWLRNITPPQLGYYKTDFKIIYEDDTEYTGRYDIGADSANLEQHIRDHLAFVGDVNRFLDRYQIGRP